MGCSDLRHDEGQSTTSVDLVVGSKLPLPLYADVRHSDDSSS